MPVTYHGIVERTAFIGFGEAGMAFADGLGSTAVAYDRKTYVGSERRAKLKDYRRIGVVPAMTSQEAVTGATTILSLVTADRALDAARETARGIVPGALFCDMNSVSPATKIAAAAIIEAAGGRYVDVAVMAPVNPRRRGVPLLIAGPHAAAATIVLQSLGFAAVRSSGEAIGDAAAVKMIRSVMVKGIEALTAECLLAAEAAGVREAVIASLDESWPGADWERRGDYNLDRMMLHGDRRAEEMEEVVLTLDAWGTGSAMSRATAVGQRRLGKLHLTPPVRLAAKLSAVLDSFNQPFRRDAA